MMKRSWITILFLFLFLCGMLCSIPATANCWEDAGNRYHIDPLLLYAIAKVESRLDPGAYNRNNDGTYDIGLMQINSRHLKKLAAFGIDEYKLQTEPCTSVMSGAWILAQFIQQMGYGWEAVGAYNAGAKASRKAHRTRYALRVWKYYGRLLSQRKQNLDALPAHKAELAIVADHQGELK